MSAAEVCAACAPVRAGATSSSADTSAIIVAGGSGERFGDPRGKQFVELCGLPLASWSLAVYDRAPSVAQIVIVCPPDKADMMREQVIAPLALTKPIVLAPGGELRQDSVRSGLAAASADLPLVAIHDAARPLTEVDLIEAILAYVRSDPQRAGAICAARVTDTLKLVEGSRIVSTPDRSFYWAAQTPQVFWRDAIVAAHERAHADGYVATDDASVIEREGGRVDVFESPRDNIKVTLPEDLASAAAILSERLLG